VTETEPDFWKIRYDRRNSCDLFLTAHEPDASMVRGFTVHRPCEDRRLWDALASVLALGAVILYFPGCRAPLVRRKDVVRHLPADLIEGLGKPVVVTNGKDIHHEIQTA
jgi:hypothetical protein